MNVCLTTIHSDNNFPTIPSLDSIEDFARLLSIIKSDTKNILTEYNIIEKNSKKHSKLEELNSLLAPFGDQWDAWANGHHSYFSRIEILIVNTYIRVPNIQEVAKEIDISPSRVEVILKKVMRRLKYPKTQSAFQEGMEIKKSNPMLKDDFLNTPIENLRTIIPSSLRSILGSSGETMAEILAITSEKELFRLRGFGKTKLVHLKEILKEYDCLDLLKK